MVENPDLSSHLTTPSPLHVQPALVPLTAPMLVFCACSKVVYKTTSVDLFC